MLTICWKEIWVHTQQNRHSNPVCYSLEQGMFHPVFHEVDFQLGFCWYFPHSTFAHHDGANLHHLPPWNTGCLKRTSEGGGGQQFCGTELSMTNNELLNQNLLNLEQTCTLQVQICFSETKKQKNCCYKSQMWVQKKIKLLIQKFCTIRVSVYVREPWESLHELCLW